MKYTFVKSSADYKMCPEETLPEVALIGRSNVGKSSLINRLLESKNAAKISSTPGKTQLINHFLVENKWYLVDLPGYGFAKVSQKERAKWDKMVKNYLLHRMNLICLFILIDSRVPPQQSDLDFVNFAGKNGIPFVLVFTKADKQSALKTQDTLRAFTTKMKETWESLPNCIVTSASTGLGRDALVHEIEQGILIYNQTKKELQKS
jgi:GTP-binding protein